MAGCVCVERWNVERACVVSCRIVDCRYRCYLFRFITIALTSVSVYCWIQRPVRCRVTAAVTAWMLILIQQVPCCIKYIF